MTAMKSSTFFFILAASVFLRPSLSLGQSSRNSSVISVEELAMPHKAARAFEKGTALIRKGNSQASLAYFRIAIDLAPTNYRPYHNLAVAQLNLGQLDDAAQNFQKSIDLTNGSFAPSLFGLSMVFYRRFEFLRAQSIIQRGLLVTPNSAFGKYCLGLVQFSLGHLADAERDALDALHLDATESGAYLLLAHVHERLHNPSAVIADVQSYLKLSPNGELQFDALALLQRAKQNSAHLSASLN